MLDERVAALHSPGSRHIEVPPALRPLVAHAFVIASEGPHVAWTVPDGTVDLVVATGEVSGVFVAGPARGPKRHVVPGPFRLAGVSLRPGAGALLRANVGDLPEDWLALQDVVGRQARGMAGDASAAAVERVLRFVSERLGAIGEEPRVLRALQLIEDKGGRLRIEALARASAASERTLLRLFHERVGLSPKGPSRIVRFQRALALIRHGRPLARVALDTGFADQAHLARELHALAGATPQSLARQVYPPASALDAVIPKVVSERPAMREELEVLRLREDVVAARSTAAQRRHEEPCNGRWPKNHSV